MGAVYAWGIPALKRYINMETSPSKLPKAIMNSERAIYFHSDEERTIWVKGYISFARQRLEDTGRWTKGMSILRNMSKLTPMEHEKLADAMNMKVMQYRSDRAFKKGVQGAKEARTALLSKHSLLNDLFEGKVRADTKGKAIEDLLNG